MLNAFSTSLRFYLQPNFTKKHTIVATKFTLYYQFISCVALYIFAQCFIRRLYTRVRHKNEKRDYYLRN